MKKISIIFVFICSIFASNAQAVSLPSVSLSPTSLQTVENNGTGTVLINFGELSGTSVANSYLGEPNLTIDINLLYIDLMSPDLNQITGSLLNYFSTNYDATTKVLSFKQSGLIPAFFTGTIKFPIKVTQNSSQAESLNGFYAVISSLDPNIDANGNASIFTFTDVNSQAGPSNVLDVKDEEIQLPGLSVYPNPTNDVVNIKLENNEISKIELFDLLGKRVISKKYNGINTTSINITHLATSVYVLKVSTDEHTRSIKLFKN